MDSRTVQRFTWIPDTPAPYESAWSIFNKIMALNLLPPHVIWDVITKRATDNKKDKKLWTHGSDWINFDKFSEAMGVPSNWLKTGFLDQLGFPIGSISRSIRVCRECLSKGYHCSFFDLAMLTTCPWHGCELTYFCGECSPYVHQHGLKSNEIDTDKYGENDEFISTGINLIYSCTCQGIKFSSHSLLKSASLTDEEQLGILVSCNQFLKWWYRINSSTHHLAPLARQAFLIDKKHWDSLNCLAIATEIAGPCPWALKIAPRPVQYLKWYQALHEQFEFNGSYDGEYAKVYKSIRRYLFKQYIRQHRKCWNEISNLKDYGEHYLNSSSICSIAFAYAKWRMDMERKVSAEEFKKRERPIYHIDTTLNFSIQRLSFQHSIRTLANLSLISFFVKLDEVEQWIDKTSITFPAYRLHTGGPDEINILFDGEHPSGDKQNSEGECTVVYPNQRYLANRAKVRCAGRIKVSDIPPEYCRVEPYSVWNYDPKRDVQFRIVNIAEQRSNYLESFAYKAH